MKLSEKIYFYRKQSGKSQEELAEQVGVSRQAVSKWETGDAEPETNKLILLAECFGVTVDWLLSSDDTLPMVNVDTKQSSAKKTSIICSWFSTIDWSYPIYLAVLFISMGLMICCGIYYFPDFQGYINPSNLLRFIDYGSFLAVAVCTALMLFASALVKAFGQAFQYVLLKRKSDTINIALCRRAVHTAMGGCILGNIVYMIIISCNLSAELSDHWMLVVGSFVTSGLCTSFYTVVFALILLPISIRLKRYLP